MTSGSTLLILPSQTAAAIEMFMISVPPQTEHLHRNANGLTAATQLQLVAGCFIGGALLGSQTWSSFFNGRHCSPATLPISAPFFFETETAWLMFVWRCWPQSFCWWLFLRFPRE